MAFEPELLSFRIRPLFSSRFDRTRNHYPSFRVDGTFVYQPICSLTSNSAMDTLYFIPLSFRAVRSGGPLIIAVVVVVVIDDDDDALPHPPPFSSSPFARGGGRDSAIGRRKSLHAKKRTSPGGKRASAIQRGFVLRSSRKRA